MSTQSRIEWTEQTWNPAVGCSKVSPGCANCYAEAMAKRLQAMRVKGYENGFALKEACLGFCKMCSSGTYVLSCGLRT